MWKWPWSRGGPSDDARLALEREVQRLRLELDERDQELAELRQHVERQQRGESDRLAQALRAQMERLFDALATRISQLHTQGHLLEVEKKPVAAADVLSSARGLVRVFEDEGMTLVGRPGERGPSDPSLHDPLQAGAGLQPGELVEIRFSGVAFQGRSLRKAGVRRREP